MYHIAFAFITIVKDEDEEPPHYWSFCFFAGRFSPSSLSGEFLVGEPGLLPPSPFSCFFSGALGFFLTTTPLSNLLVSFFATGGLGFGKSLLGFWGLESEIGIGGGGGPLRAATALQTA